MSDAVQHPSHYTSHPSGVECIDITKHMNFCLGNAIKYIWRADLKHDNAIEDLEKAKQYLQFEIERRKKYAETNQSDTDSSGGGYSKRYDRRLRDLPITTTTTNT